MFDIEGNVLDKWEIPTCTANEGSAILPDVAASIQAKIAEKSMELTEIAGIGVGVPGPVNSEGVVPHTANLSWGRKEVSKELLHSHLEKRNLLKLTRYEYSYFS